MFFRAVTLLLILPMAGLTGRVLDNSGKPIAGVRLETGPANTETDANGNFHFASPYSVIFAIKEGFTPQAYVLKPDDTAITLKMASETDRLEFPRCSEDIANLTAPAVLPLGNGLVTPIPKTVQHESSDRGDSGDEQYFLPANKIEKLTYSWDVKSRPDLPPPDYILKSTEWHARSTSNNPYSTEWRGTLKDGNKWLWIHFAAVPNQPAMKPGSTWWYYDIPDRTATLFDHILDQTCAR